MSEELEDVAEDVVEPTPDPYADEAQKYGWKPAEEWVGEGHMSAEAFMTRGPGTSRKLEAKLKDAEAKLTTIEQSFDERMKRQENAMQAAADARVKAVEARFKQEILTAAEAGDTERVKHVMAQQEAFAKGSQEQNVTEPQTDANGPSDADREKVAKWMDSQDWWMVDHIKTGTANGLWNQAISRGMQDIDEILAHIEEGLSEPSPPARTAAAVDGGGVGGVRKPNGKSYADIPADDRRLAEDNFLSEQYYIDAAAAEKMTPQQMYARDYWAQEAE